MDFCHLIHEFTKLSTTTVNSYCCDKSPPLAMYLLLCSADLPVYNI